MHLTHNFPFLSQAVLDSNAGCGTLCFVVVDAIHLISLVSFQRGRVTCDESCAIIHTVRHLQLIYEAKVQVLSVFSWKPAKPRYIKTKSLYLSVVSSMRFKCVFFSRKHPQKIGGIVVSGKSDLTEIMSP